MAVTVGAVVVRGARPRRCPAARPTCRGSGPPAGRASPLLVRTLALRAALLVTTVRRDVGGGGPARRPPGGEQRLGPAGPRPRRHRHRGAGPDRHGARRRRRARRPRGRRARWCAGVSAPAPCWVCCSRRPARCCGPAVLGRPGRPLGHHGGRSWSPPSRSRSPATSSSSTASSSAPATAASSPSPASPSSRCTRPLALLVAHAGEPGTPRLVLLWAAFAGGFLLLRAVFLGLRARSDALAGHRRRPLTRSSGTRCSSVGTPLLADLSFAVPFVVGRSSDGSDGRAHEAEQAPAGRAAAAAALRSARAPGPAARAAGPGARDVLRQPATTWTRPPSPAPRGAGGRGRCSRRAT